MEADVLPTMKRVNKRCSESISSAQPYHPIQVVSAPSTFIMDIGEKIIAT